MFSEEAKAGQRETQWPIDCENAEKLGKVIVGKARKKELFE